ncbi:MAG: phage tail tape measure protein [Clostridia bacterium]|nr:phage tail tape measure protein [Clostridia bacterium]
MPTRNISTKLAIQGESEYRASLQRINSELKAVQSSLKLVESKYLTNANTMEALRAKGDALQAVYKTQKDKVDELRKALENAQAAQKNHSDAVEAAKKKIEENNKRLEELKKTTGDTSKEEKALTDENKELAKQMETSQKKMEAAEKGVNSWQTQLNNAEIQLNNLDAEIQKNDKYMDEAQKSADGCATSIDEFGKEVDETSESVKGLGTILASQELQEFAAKIKDALVDCAKAYSDFEVGMAGVKRTTGITGPALTELGEDFKTLSTEIPITTQELTSIATTAGQLGVKGKENVEAFTKVMALLSTTTDLTADTAATMLAQFSNITGVTDYERLGSVVASLGDATATTATKVVEMSQGIAATGTLAGMNARDIMAISAAVGSLGIESAAGSTAMSTLISTLYKATQTGTKLDEFAAIAGMSASEFKQSWGTDAVGTLDLFIQGLNDTERNGKSAIVLLDELGITNVRQVKAILGLASAEGLLTGTIKQANEAWNQNTALNDKAAVMFDTMQAKMTTLDSATNNLKIAVGEALAPAIITLAEGGQKAIEGITDFIQKHPTLTESLTIVASSIVGITTAIAGAKAAYKALDFLGMAKPLKEIASIAAGAGGGITGLGAALGALALPAATAATALAGVVAVVDRIHEVKEVGFLGEGHTLEEYADNVETYRKKVEELQRDYDSLALCGGDLTMAQDALDMATIALTNAQNELAAAEEAAAQAQVEQTQASQEATEGMKSEAQSVEYQAQLNEEMADSIAAVAKSYKEAYDACRESLDGQISLFDNYAASISEDTDTAQEMLDLWAQQTQNLAAYTENLQKAAQYGLDAGLVASLADGSAQSAGYLATIIAEIENAGNGLGTIGHSSEEAVAAFNANFEKTEEAKNHLAATMTAINEGLTEQLAELEQTASEIGFEGFWDAVDAAFEDVGAKFGDIGLNMGAGLSTGITGSKEDVSAAATETVTAANDAAKEAAGEHSPSTIWRDIGKNMDAGLVQGVEAEESSVLSTVISLGEHVNTSMEAYGKLSSQSFANAFAQLSMQMGQITAILHSATISGLSGLSNDMYIIGNNSVVGMINGILSRSGDLYAAMYFVTTQAIAAAKSAAEVHSPSRKTIAIFENVGEGMIVGIENRKKALEEKMQAVVDSALDIDVKTNLADKMVSVDDRAPSVSEKETEASSRANTVTITRGDTVINVYGAQGQDVRALAREIASLINDDVAEEDATWA